MKGILIFCIAMILLGMLTPGMGHSAIRAEGPTAIPTMVDDDVVIDLKNALKLTSKASHEEIQAPLLTIDVCWPVLSGRTGPTIDNFNQAVDQIVKEAVGKFRDDSLQVTPDAALPAETEAKGSYITLWYEIATANSALLSLKFHITWYRPGQAHPNEYSVTLNYDLTRGVVLALRDLFRADADYLKVISDYSIQTLRTAGTLFFPAGAAPKEVNYSRWNIDFKGLRITFDVPQVAPRVAGAQIVVVPYTVLKPIINPSGVLAAYAG
jgi:hypothetical protein